MIEGVISKLLDTSAVTSLVTTRIHPSRRPQSSALPSIVLTTVSVNPVYTDDGEAGLDSSRVQVDCWGKTYSEAKTVARSVRDALSAFVGESDGVVFQNVLLDAEQDMVEGGSNSAEYLFRTSLDFIIWTEK